MKVKVAEATGPVLDWLVAECEKIVFGYDIDKGAYQPSTDWAVAGPIIEREEISVLKHADQKYWWAGSLDSRRTATGPTPLIAAMRCYVASKLGGEVEVPEELE